ncbi:MAG: DNA repair protein RadC [bacterium]|nr:DNA repair protein RadC [bacterium]
MKYIIRPGIEKIKDLPVKNQPREKLRLFGPESLSNYELLAIILNNGSRSEDILSLSKRILNDYGQIEIMNYRNVDNIQKHFSLSFVKACQIVATLELGSRLFNRVPENNIILNTPKKVFEYVKDMQNLKKEIFRGLYVNIKNRLIHDEIITMGNNIENIIVPPLIFYPAINCYAQGIILVHNHPSQDKKPSKEDMLVTKNMIEAGDLLRMPVLDHLIIVKNDYFSFNENRMMKVKNFMNGSAGS